ncbi:MAG TPA: glycine C-acetyltransferase [Devosia sp.]|nr:glycine C-acetyltransferase [Devosia sp.]
MYETAKAVYAQQLAEIESAGLWKHERLITSPQAAHITTNGKEVINFCANNYLGLSSHPRVMAAAKKALDARGYGLSSVRFICGTQDSHKELEAAISKFLGTEDTILYSSCFDANGGLFETVLGEQDAIISDALNHASIIDGIRLSKAQRYRYANGDMDELETRLKAAASQRFKLIVTDGVFSMDGHVAKLAEICALAERYGAMVMIDDCHATGHLGTHGRGTPELTGVGGKVDIVSGTFGKTLGGAMGGFIAASQPIIHLLRQRARPYLFSNALPPAMAAGALKAVEIAAGADDRRDLLNRHTQTFRTALTAAGFTLVPGTTPIIPVMLHEATMAQAMAAEVNKRGVLVSAFSFPVVPKGQARIRTQMSAALSEADVDLAIAAFIDAGKALNLI